jgi:hypothetical protein
MHQTLQEFLAYTKGVSYLLAVILLIGSIPFWHFLTEREEKEKN